MPARGVRACVQLGLGWESLDRDWKGERRAPPPWGRGGGRPVSEPAGAGSLPALLALVAVAGAGGSRESWWQPGAAWGRQVPALGSALGAASVGWFVQVSLHTWCFCRGDGDVSLGVWRANLPCVPEAGARRRPWAGDGRLPGHAGPRCCCGALRPALETGWLP